MTEFRPGQRVRVNNPQAGDMNGQEMRIRHVVCSTLVEVDLPSDDLPWFIHVADLELVPEPGIPAHLYPSNARHLPEWVGKLEWRR